MDQSVSFYKQSGKTGALGPVWTFLFTAIGGAILGIIYSYLIRWIPFIYLNFIITAIFGGGLLFFLVWGATLGHVRNNLVRLVFGGLGIFAAYYVHWVAWMGAMGFGWVWDPKALWNMILVVNENGAWSIRSSDPVKGTFLWIIWGIEALIIWGLGLMGVVSAAKTVYCEKCNDWATEHDELQRVDLAGAEVLLDGLSANEFSTLSQLQPADPAAAEYLEIEISRCEKCKELSTLSMDHISITHDKKGKEEKSEKTLVENALIPYDVTEDLVGRFSSPEEEEAESAEEDEA